MKTVFYFKESEHNSQLATFCNPPFQQKASAFSNGKCVLVLYIPNPLTHYILRTLPLLYFLGVSGLFSAFILFSRENPITPHYVASDLGLHCLSMTILRISR